MNEIVHSKSLIFEELNINGPDFKIIRNYREVLLCLKDNPNKNFITELRYLISKEPLLNNHSDSLPRVLDVTNMLLHDITLNEMTWNGGTLR